MRRLSTFQQGVVPTPHVPRGRYSGIIDLDLCGTSGAEPISEPKHKCATEECITLVNEDQEFCRACKKKRRLAALDDLRISSEGKILKPLPPKRIWRKVVRTKMVSIDGEIRFIKCHFYKIISPE